MELWTNEWNDVTPIKQPISNNAVAQIAYTPEFDVVMNYFRAVLSSGEKSERALELTKRVIEGNAANYTAWFYRRECLFELASDLYVELKFITECSLESPKNYQIWYHRRAIVDKLGDSSQELNFIKTILDDDAKNYHAWSYRQFVVSRFDLWDGELQFTATLIEEDIRNNSAWNQRWFVIEKTCGFKDVPFLSEELEYVMDCAELAPNNESPFNYLLGIFRLLKKSSLDELFFSSVKTVLAWGEGLLVKLADKSHSQLLAAHPPTVIGLLFELNVFSGNIPQAISLATNLADEYDSIRCKYWNYRINKIQESAPLANSVGPPVIQSS